MRVNTSPTFPNEYTKKTAGWATVIFQSFKNLTPLAE